MMQILPMMVVGVSLLSGCLSDPSDLKRRTSSTDFGRVFEAQQVSSYDEGISMLVLRVPDDGILYKIKAYFTSTHPIYLQIWEPDHHKLEFRLKHQMVYVSDRINVTQTIYTVADRSKTRPDCPVIREDDMLAISAGNGSIPIPIQLSATRSSTLIYRHTKPIDIGATKTFSSITFPFTFSIKGYIVKPQRLASLSAHPATYQPCPMNKMEDYQPITDSMTTAPPYIPPTITRGSVPVSGVTRSVAPGRDTVTTAEGPLLSTVINEARSAQQRPNVLHLAVGVVTGVVVVITIVAVSVIFCRRVPRDKSKKTDAHEITNQSISSLSHDRHGPATDNPAYGQNMDFLNAYESPDRPRPASTRLYQPIVPSRHGVSPQHNKTEPDEVTTGPYEEIRPDGRTVPGVNVRAHSKKSVVYEDCHNYLEMLSG